jgi:hypothetical protein
MHLSGAAAGQRRDSGNPARHRRGLGGRQARQELSFTNQELRIVDVENQEKLADLDEAYAKVDNLLNPAEPATVFLDRDLPIRRFRESIEARFELDTRDSGQPLSHFSSRPEPDANRRILADAELVLATGHGDCGRATGTMFMNPRLMAMVGYARASPRPRHRRAQDGRSIMLSSGMTWWRP